MFFRLAWRNIWRNKKRTVITLSVMIFGIISGLLTFAVGDGSHLQMIRVATSTFIGHIQINRKGFHQTQKLELAFSENSEPVKLLKSAERGEITYTWQKRLAAWSPRLFGGALISTGNNTAGSSLLGIDLARESAVTTLPGGILRA